MLELTDVSVHYGNVAAVAGGWVKVEEGEIVAVLPAGMAASPQGEGLRFASGGLEALVRGLPARGSVLVVLSGADPVLIDAVTPPSRASSARTSVDTSSWWRSRSARGFSRTPERTGRSA